MKTITLAEKKNGYSVEIQGFIRKNGEYVYKATELVKLMEDVGELLLDSKIAVTLK